MNYIKEINAFRNYLKTNSLEAITQALWYILIDYHNSCNWERWIAIDNTRLMSELNVSEKTLISHRNKLIQSGLLEYKSQQRKKNSGKYKLLSFELSEILGKKTAVNTIAENKTTGNNSADDSVDRKADDSADRKADDSDINKPKYKQKNKEIDKEKTKFAEFVAMTNAEYEKLVGTYGIEKASRMIEKLNNYKGANGKSYRSDYLAILNWVAEKVINEYGNKSQSATPISVPNAAAYKSNKDKCPICNDTGWVVVDGQSQRCECQKG